jgi:hypothetical protein
LIGNRHHAQIEQHMKQSTTKCQVGWYGW